MRLFFLAALLFVASAAHAQTTYLPLGSEDYRLLDRLETMSDRLSPELFLTNKPVPRRGLATFLDAYVERVSDEPVEQEDNPLGVGARYASDIDRFLLYRALSTSSEWTEYGALPSRRPILKHFYRYQSDFFQARSEKFFIAANPVLAVRGMAHSHNQKDPTLPATEQRESDFRFLNSRGAEIRGRIADRIGFYTFFTDNQETSPTFVQNWVRDRQAVPGSDYFQEPKPGKYDYLLARGYVDFAAVKDHVNITLGYDQHFIGDGVRSLFLSDFASSGAAFVRINTRIWKLNYQNLYMELTPQYARGSDRVLPNKYATVHHLSINATRWLNIGLFEAICFARPNAYEFSYLNPIILYRHVERMNGSPDNALLGLNAKAIILRRAQLYGQLILDEFRSSELTSGRGWWANKFGLQAGAKYFDAFGIPNLDVQAELNLVRPFTYSHNDTFANWTHYNQPLAHPLGAGFREVIGIVRYRPAPGLELTARGMIYDQGGTSSTENFGVDIFRPNHINRPSDYGFGLVNNFGRRVRLASLLASWEARDNLFLEASGTWRNSVPRSTQEFPATTTYATLGFRLNMPRRDYDFF